MPTSAQKSRKLVLHRETIRSLQDQAQVRFGPHTSETEPCCPTEGTLVDTVVRTYRKL